MALALARIEPTVGYLRAVPTLETAGIWPEAAAVLAPALALTEGRWTADDVLSWLVVERFQLWVFEVNRKVTTACITHVHNYPRCRALQVVFVAGDGFDLWPQWFADLTAWGRAIGCRFIEGDGRYGWEREMKAAGLRKIGTRYSLRLEEISDA